MDRQMTNGSSSASLVTTIRGIRAVRTCLLVSAIVAAFSEAAIAQAVTPGEVGFFRFGVTWPAVHEKSTDFPGAGTALRLDASRLTFPHVAAGWIVKGMTVEAGYRKLGVLTFRRVDGTVDGNTHSNALQLALLPATWRRGRATAHPRFSMQGVRTIQTLRARSNDWPYRGDVNTWKLLPGIGLDATVAVSDRWGIAVTYEAMLGQLGTLQETGRYRQQFVGVDLVYARHR